MIGKVTRGGDMAGLMRYLVGPGRANEHTTPHLVAGDGFLMAQWDDSALGQVDARAIADYIDEPRIAYNVKMGSKLRMYDTDTKRVAYWEEERPAHVWHCSLSLRPGTKLEDEQWGAIARDVIDGMGFSAVDGRATTRWAAVHHGLTANGGDHIHLAINLIREDGTKANVYRDFTRLSAILSDVEKKHGLEQVAGREHARSAPAISKGEHYELTDPKKIAARAAEGKDPLHEPYSKTLARKVRAVAVASATEAEFVRRLRGESLWVRPRFAAGTQDVIVGYSVAERPNRGEKPQYRSGTNLGKDLSLPRLRSTWLNTPQAHLDAAAEWRDAWRGGKDWRERRTAAEMQAPTAETWALYTGDMADLREQLRGVDPTDKATWARLAHEASGVLAAWSLRLEQVPGPLARASDEMAGAAALHTRYATAPAVRDMSMRGAARLLMMSAVGTDSKAAQAMLLRQLIVTLSEMHRMFEQTNQLRETQRLAVALDVELRQVHDLLTSGSATSTDVETTAATQTAPAGETPTVQSPVPGRLTPRDPNTELERPGVARTGAVRPGAVPGHNPPEVGPDR